MNRESVIQVVGSVIGRSHPVDLKTYDLLILVETVKVYSSLSWPDVEYYWDKYCSGFRQIETIQRGTIVRSVSSKPRKVDKRSKGGN